MPTPCAECGKESTRLRLQDGEWFCRKCAPHAARRNLGLDLPAEAVAYEYDRPVGEQVAEDQHFDSTSVPDYVDKNRVPHWKGNGAIKRRDRYLKMRGYVDQTQKGS